MGYDWECTKSNNDLKIYIELWSPGVTIFGRVYTGNIGNHALLPEFNIKAYSKFVWTITAVSKLMAAVSIVVLHSKQRCHVSILASDTYSKLHFVIAKQSTWVLYFWLHSIRPPFKCVCFP